MDAAARAGPEERARRTHVPGGQRLGAVQFVHRLPQRQHVSGLGGLAPKNLAGWGAVHFEPLAAMSARQPGCHHCCHLSAAITSTEAQFSANLLVCSHAAVACRRRQHVAQPPELMAEADGASGSSTVHRPSRRVARTVLVCRRSGAVTATRSVAAPPSPLAR